MTSEFDPNSLTIEQALAYIEQDIEPIREHETLPIRQALGRVLATDIVAPLDVPPYTNSAMDGYALRAQDLSTESAATLKVVGTAYAGHPHTVAVQPGECVRIMTGAVLPPGTDSVVMQEHTEATDDTVIIKSACREGENVRLAGEDLKTGDKVLSSGRCLNASDIGLLASLGIGEIEVLRRPVVAFFSTGDELQGLGTPLAEGQLYDSNRYTLHAMLQRLNVEILDMGVVADEQAAIEDAFRTAAQRADVVITTGGVSVGAADYIKHVLERLGKIGFWKIAMKPGRPLAFGRLSDAVFLGLPGNPVSVMATFTLFARVAILRLSGAQTQAPLRLKARTNSRLKKRPGRADFQRGILRQEADGELVVETTGLQGSHVLSSMSRANCFISLPREAGDIESGTQVEVIPFDGIL